MIDNNAWNTIKTMFLELLGWARGTILFNLTLNGVYIHLTIFDFLVGVFAFELIIGVVWAVLHRGDKDD